MRLAKRFAVVATALVLVAACGSSSKSSNPTSGGGGTKPVVKIGVQGPLSGPNSALGINEDWGVKLAVKQANDDELQPIDGLVVYAGNDNVLARTLDFGGTHARPRGQFCRSAARAGPALPQPGNPRPRRLLAAALGRPEIGQAFECSIADDDAVVIAGGKKHPAVAIAEQGTSLGNARRRENQQPAGNIPAQLIQDFVHPPGIERAFRPL